MLSNSRRLSVEKDVRSKLGRLPETLREQYATIYQDIIESGPSTASIARKTFSWILAAQRALSTEEFVAAVALEDDGYYHADLDVSRVLDICRNLIVVVSTDDDQSSQSFQVAHLSVKEYLMSMPDFSSEGIHTTAMLRCLQTFDPRSLVEKRFVSRMEDMSDMMRDYRIHLFDHAELSELTRSSSSLATIMKAFLFDDNLNCTSTLQEWTNEVETNILLGKLSETTNLFVLRTKGHLCFPRQGLHFVCICGLLSVLENWGDNFELLRGLFRGCRDLTLGCAVSRRRYAIVQWILEKRIFDAYDISTGMSGFSNAIYDGDVVSVDLFLKHGADPLADDHRDYYERAFKWVRKRTGPGIFRSLLLTIERTCKERPAQYSGLEFDWKMGPLFQAVHYDWTEAIEMLIEYGVDVCSRPTGTLPYVPQGSNTLQMAIKFSSLATIQTLLKLARKSSSEADKRKPASAKAHFDTWVNSLDDQGRSAILCLGERNFGTSEDNESIMKLLLAHNADPRITDSDGTTATHVAARIGSLHTLQSLQGMGLDLCSRAKSGATVLHAAAGGMHSTSKVVRFLIAEGLDPLDTDHEGRTSLHYAAISCNTTALTALCEALLSSNPITKLSSHGPTAFSASAPNATATTDLALPRPTFFNITDLKGNTPLHLVGGDVSKELYEYSRDENTDGRTNHIEDTIQLLLDLGVDINQQNNAGQTPVFTSISISPYFSLRYNAEYKVRDKAMKVLLTKGANACVSDVSGLTPLHCAARRRRDGAVKELLRAGADIEAKDHRMSTPLHVSSESGAHETTACLLQYGANPRAGDIKQATPLHYTVQSSNYEKSVPSMISLLVRAKADINAIDNTGSTPLHWAVKKSDTEIVRALLYHKANPDIADSYGSTPLHYAAQVPYDYPDMISVLIRSQTNIDSKDNSGSTPLHLAAKLGRAKIVQKLLHADADPDTINNQGANAMQIAANEASIIHKGEWNKSDAGTRTKRTNVGNHVDFLRVWYHLYKALVDRGSEHKLQSAGSRLKHSQSVILRTDQRWGDFSHIRAEEIAHL